MLLTWISMFILTCQLKYCMSQYNYYQGKQENRLSWPYRQIISQPVGIPTRDLYSNIPKYLNGYQPGKDNEYNENNDVNADTANGFEVSAPTHQESYPQLHNIPNSQSVNENGYETETANINEVKPVGTGSGGRGPQGSAEYLIMPSGDSQTKLIQSSGLSHLTQRDSDNHDAWPRISDQLQQVPETVQNQGVLDAEHSSVSKMGNPSEMQAQQLLELDKQARDVPLDTFEKEKYLDESAIEWDNQKDKLQAQPNPSEFLQPSTGENQPTLYWDYQKPGPLISNDRPTQHYSEQMYRRPDHTVNYEKPIVQTLYGFSNNYPQHLSANEIRKGNIDDENPTLYHGANNQNSRYARIKKSSNGAATDGIKTTDFANVERKAGTRIRHQPRLWQNNKGNNQAELNYLTEKIRGDISKMDNDAHHPTEMDSNKVWRAPQTTILKHQRSNLKERSLQHNHQESVDKENYMTAEQANTQPVQESSLKHGYQESVNTQNYITTDQLGNQPMQDIYLKHDNQGSIDKENYMTAEQANTQPVQESSLKHGYQESVNTQNDITTDQLGNQPMQDIYLKHDNQGSIDKENYMTADQPNTQPVEESSLKHDYQESESTQNYIPTDQQSNQPTQDRYLKHDNQESVDKQNYINVDPQSYQPELEMSDKQDSQQSDDKHNYNTAEQQNNQAEESRYLKNEYQGVVNKENYMTPDSQGNEPGQEITQEQGNQGSVDEENYMTAEQTNAQPVQERSLKHGYQESLNTQNYITTDKQHTQPQQQDAKASRMWTDGQGTKLGTTETGENRQYKVTDDQAFANKKLYGRMDNQL